VETPACSLPPSYSGADAGDAPDYTVRTACGTGSDTGFVGLTNQGATCYLNSLVQALYMTPDFRHALFTRFAYAEHVHGRAEFCIPLQLQVRGVVVNCLHLHIWSVCAAVFVQNRTACRFPSSSRITLTAASVSHFLVLLHLHTAPTPTNQPKQLLFARLKYSRHRAAVATQPLTHSFHWTQADAFRQHDVQELMRVLFQVRV
jgi:hypothetical protein